MNLFEVTKKKKLGRFESLIFAVELLANSAVTLCFEHAFSHFTFHISFEVLSVECYMIIDYR